LIDQRNSGENGPEGFFTAAREVADNLRLEASIATPEQQKDLHDAALSIKTSIIQHYGPHILAEALERSAHIEDRIVVMDKGTFDQFYGEWDGSGDKPADSILAATFSHGDVIALKDPNEAWHTFDNDAQRRLVQQFGDEATARRMVANVSVIDNLTHEVVHQFQDNSLPSFFLEIATRYYQRQTTSELRFGHIDIPAMDDSAALYGEAIGRYGEAVHDVYFGKPVAPALRSEIVSAITSGASNFPSLGHLE
jgi:hypothetical protein